MSTSDYIYTEQSRRPTMILVCLLCLCFVGVGASLRAPWYAVLAPGIALAMSFFMIVFNRVSGCRLASDTLELYSGKWHQVVLIGTIASVRVKSWSDGAPSVKLYLKTAKPFDIPSMCLGSVPQFTRALEQRGVAITQIP